MTTLRTMSRRTVILACVAQSLVCVAPPLAFAESPTIDIVGDYRYAYHEPETVAEAKQVACLRALRQAISTTAAVRERTVSIVDSKFFHNLIQTLAAQHASNQQILQQSEKGRTVYCKVRQLFSQIVWNESSWLRQQVEMNSA